ncbi:MAG TPA: hypothetical protein VLW85_10670 [Myxococcales bacterium]|nr:hypothetical protein [Myxococcales bacterium]
MSYRIQVHPEAGSLLRAFAPHVVLRLGRALADLAAALADGDDLEDSELHVEDCVMQFVVNHAQRLLEVVHVEQRQSLQPAWAQAHAQ